MKMGKLIILFVIISLPFFIMNSIKTDQIRKSNSLELRYNRVVDTATQDAAKILIMNAKQSHEAKYESFKDVRINKEEAVQTFLNTMYLNFGVFNDRVGQGVIDSYIPIIAIVGYDGYDLYYMDQYVNESGQHIFKHVWSPTKPYAYADSAGNSYSFTLDDYVTVNRATDQSWIEGYRGEIASSAHIPFLNDADTFEQVRRSTIVNSIQQDLEYNINEYNNYAKKIGVSYTFTLPLISQEQWNNTIDDMGVIAFVQGIPMGTGYYNNYALGGSRVLKMAEYRGIIANGRKYYYASNACTSTAPTVETFFSAKDAASKGYIPIDCR